MRANAPDTPKTNVSRNPSRSILVSLDNPLWNYALTHYANPQVRDICLQWQNEFDADVNLLLACGWLAQRQRGFDPDLDFNAINSWRADIVIPLRSARNGLDKKHRRQNTLRERILQLELQAERYEISLIYALLSGTEKEDLSSPQEAMETVSLCRRNLLDYLSRLDGALEVNQAQLNLMANCLATEM
ncbi:uncharacterized conserved protein [Hahella chejuensis KCTC 2396]|uniref:Uncharacterized conserved protein n=1 Tax=Hahella chejuensis (strain KCTC 2396) TaxID=349521 RepID=Q2SQ81_HAHCH|nr:TIGR02444 family protein [Hahella chejuensis]ABC27193.1 uncharacterized conserved protein [Hahella chejuensis KCTC 2396]